MRIDIDGGTTYSRLRAWKKPGARDFGIISKGWAVGSSEPCQISIVTMGHTKAEAGGAIAVGSPLDVDELGRVVALSGSGIPAGRALSQATMPGEIIEIFINSRYNFWTPGAAIK